MSYVAVEVDHVSKTFKRQTGIGNSFMERALAIGRGKTEVFNALDDVAFDVQAGQTVGILGHNGSGKSTLLKIISGTIRPNAGAVRVRGSMSALLELGAGFHPDLTGRENVYLNGSILGFSKAQIDAMIDDIVDFSEIPAFIDTQVRNYSSGMFARLGFAVAVNLKPDVLLIDEVLAVGDEAFQRKCLERVRGFQKEGRTIIIVTHSPDMVRLFCDTAVVLNSGKMIYEGEPGDGVVVYRDALETRTGIRHGDGVPTELAPADRKKIVITGVEFEGGSADEDGAFHPGEQLRMRVRYAAGVPIDAMRATIWLYSHDGLLIANLSSFDLTGGDIHDVQPGTGELVYTIDDLPLLQGRFEVTVAFQDVNETFEYDRHQSPNRFSVVSGSTGAGRVRLKTSLEHRPPSVTQNQPDVQLQT